MTSRPFDPNWTTDSKRLNAYLHDLCAQLSKRGAGQRRRRQDAQSKFDASIRSIVLDLFRAHKSDPRLEVGIGTGTTSLQKLSSSRYGASFISARTFRDALAALEKAELVIESTPFWHDPAGKDSRVARYMASPFLLDGLRQAGASITDLYIHKNAEGIRLKDEHKVLLEYGCVKFAEEARDRLRTINEMLESHWADLALSDDQIALEVARIRGTRDDEAAQSFDFAARTVYRVFNNDDWGQGGRFYGAWWMSCPSKLRKYILINGKPTVEVDYSGLHAAMLYAESGQPIPEDPYERCLTKSGNKDERKFVKLTFNGLLNTDSINKFSEIDDYSQDVTGRSWPEFKEFVFSKYPEFERHFCTGVGLRLQRKDSDMAEAIMLKFASMGYACLPVHDSFIVHHGLKDDLDHIMRKTFEDKFGVSSGVGVDWGIGEVVETNDLPIESRPIFLNELEGYDTRLQAFWDR